MYNSNKGITNNGIMKQILFFVCIVLTLYSCSKDDYLVDGGVSDPNVGTTTFEFLASNPQLDTLAILIEKAGLKDKVNGESTLFAPNNLSIREYVNDRLATLRQADPEAQFTINDIEMDTLTRYMGAYIFPEKIARDVMTKEGEIYTAVNGDERRISLEPVQNYSELSEPPLYVYYTYKKGDNWDEWNKVDDDIKIDVRTSNLVSTNGIIHVLQGTHILFNKKQL